MATNGRADWRRLRLLELFVGVYRERMDIVERMHTLVAMIAIRNVKSILAGIHRRTERLLDSTGALLGCICGLRSLTAPAVVCWAAHFGWLRFAGTRLGLLDRPMILIAVTVLAIGELIAGKLPKTPSRTAPLGLIARIVLGAGSAAALAVSAQGALTLAVVAGSFGGRGWCFCRLQRSPHPGHEVGLAGFCGRACRGCSGDCRRNADRVARLTMHRYRSA